MMKKLLVGCIFATACLSATGAFADGSVSPVYVNQASGYVQTTMSLKDIVKPIAKLMAATSQASKGAGNWSLISQKGSNNQATVAQSGFQNTGFIAQTGLNNTAMLQQYSVHQQAFIIQSGVGNIATVTQR